jgi:hypothetical protein
MPSAGRRVVGNFGPAMRYLGEKRNLIMSWLPVVGATSPVRWPGHRPTVVGRPIAEESWG